MAIIFSQAYDRVTQVLNDWAAALAQVSGVQLRAAPPTIPVCEALAHYGHGSPSGLESSTGVWTTPGCLSPPTVLVAICCYGAQAGPALGGGNVRGVGFSDELLVPTGAVELQGPFGACCQAAGVHVMHGGSAEQAATVMQQKFRLLAARLFEEPGVGEMGAIVALNTADQVRSW